MSQKLLKAFKEFDTDESGKLSAAEFVAILTRRTESGEPMSIEDAEAFVAQFDSNDDGELDFIEYCSAMKGGAPVLQKNPLRKAALDHLAVQMPNVAMAEVEKKMAEIFSVFKDAEDGSLEEGTFVESYCAMSSKLIQDALSIAIKFLRTLPTEHPIAAPLEALLSVHGEEEWLALIKELLEPIIRSFTLFTYRLIDLDHDGYVTPDDLRFLLLVPTLVLAEGKIPIPEGLLEIIAEANPAYVRDQSFVDKMQVLECKDLDALFADRGFGEAVKAAATPETIWFALDTSGNGTVDAAELTSVAKDAWSLLAEAARGAIGFAQKILLPRALYEKATDDGSPFPPEVNGAIRALQDVFRSVDESGNGKVNVEEILAAREKLPGPLNGILSELQKLDEADPEQVEAAMTSDPNAGVFLADGLAFRNSLWGGLAEAAAAVPLSQEAFSAVVKPLLLYRLEEVYAHTKERFALAMPKEMLLLKVIIEHLGPGLQEGPLEAFIDFLFTVLDAGSKGAVPLSQITHLTALFASPGGATMSDRLKALIAILDTDDDGKFTFDDLVAFLDKLVQALLKLLSALLDGLQPAGVSLIERAVADAFPVLSDGKAEADTEQMLASLSNIGPLIEKALDVIASKAL